MKLIIGPDLKSNQNNLVKCKEELDITADKDIKEIELDVAKLKIKCQLMQLNFKNRDSKLRTILKNWNLMMTIIMSIN
jgi:hypothetical protein